MQTTLTQNDIRKAFAATDAMARLAQAAKAGGDPETEKAHAALAGKLTLPEGVSCRIMAAQGKPELSFIIGSDRFAVIAADKEGAFKMSLVVRDADLQKKSLDLVESHVKALAAEAEAVIAALKAAADRMGKAHETRVAAALRAL